MIHCLVILHVKYVRLQTNMINVIYFVNIRLVMRTFCVVFNLYALSFAADKNFVYDVFFTGLLCPETPK